MTPEEKARVKIDRLFNEAGWTVVNRDEYEPTMNAGAIMQGEHVKVETRYTGETEEVSNKETKNYTKTELNRSIINPSQIKLILTTYRDAVYTDMFNDPQREQNFEYLPKTLIFALNEAHATNIVNIAKEVFGVVSGIVTSQ